jgi:hypothetical protein
VVPAIFVVGPRPASPDGGKPPTAKYKRPLWRIGQIAKTGNQNRQGYQLRKIPSSFTYSKVTQIQVLSKENIQSTLCSLILHYNIYRSYNQDFLEKIKIW